MNLEAAVIYCDLKRCFSVAASLGRLCESSIFGARAVFGMDACHVFSLGCAGLCRLGGGYDWCFVNRVCTGC